MHHKDNHHTMVGLCVDEYKHGLSSGILLIIDLVRYYLFYIRHADETISKVGRHCRKPHVHPLQQDGSAVHVSRSPSQ